MVAAALSAGCGGAAPPTATPLPAVAAATPRPTGRPTPTVTPNAPAPSPAPASSPTLAPSPEITKEPPPAFPKGAVTAAAATEKVGKVAIVCGKVVTATYATSTRGKPTFLSLGRAYPKQLFTILIWEEDRPAFDRPPEEAFRDQWACIEGRVEDYKGVPQITSVGGDVYEPAAFVPWPKDAYDCVREGSKMDLGCETYLDVLIEIRATEAEMYSDMYKDALDDLYGDPYIDAGPGDPGFDVP